MFLAWEEDRLSENYFDRISQMIGGPVSEGWFDPEPVERVLGRSLPEDYVSLMDRYGGVVSTIEEAELLFTVVGDEGLDPAEAVERGNYPVYFLSEVVSEFLFMDDSRRVETSWIVSRDPYNVFHIGEVFGEEIYLFYDPEFLCWTVVLGTGDEWWQFRGGICELLVKMVSGEVDLPYLEQGFFSGSTFIQDPRLIEAS